MFKSFFNRRKKEKHDVENEDQRLSAQEKEEDTELVAENAESIGEDINDELAVEYTEKKAEEIEEMMDVLEEIEEIEEAQEIISENLKEQAQEILEEAEAVEAEEAIVQPEQKLDEEESEEHKKLGFFARLKEGLSKTRDAILGKVDDILSAFRTIDEELYEELEEALITADIGVDTSLYIIDELKNRAKAKGLTEASALKQILKEIISEVLKSGNNEVDLSGKPAVIMVIGVNGVGKTTSIGKLANKYKKEGKKVLLAAADTFRAAAIDQLQIWADRAGVDMIKHQEGSDPSAVVFDAIKAARSRGADIVICDTAGRLHNKKHLMEELKKTARVVERETGKPSNEVLLVLDASTGQNALVQAREFADAASITGVILTKLDGTAKGGVIIALSREQNIGVKFVGVGERIDDLQEFNAQEFANALFPEE